MQCSDVTTGLEEECSHVIEPGPRELEELKSEGLNVQCSDATTVLEEECSHVIEPGPRELEELKSEGLNEQCSGATTSLEEECSNVIERGSRKIDTRIGHGNSGNKSTPSVELGDATSSQDILNLIADRYFRTIDPSSGDDLNGFLQYMKLVREVIISDVKIGSLIITAKCTSLEILDELWKAHRTGSLNEMAQFLVTEDVLKTFGLTEVRLITTIVEEEYEACREVFLKQRAGRYILWILSARTSVFFGSSFIRREEGEKRRAE